MGADMYEFTEDCLIHVKEIDEEHQKLFELLNEAVEQSGSADDIAAAADRLLLQLRQYAATHFAHEEAYMEKLHDPELALQKKEHAAFAAKMEHFELDRSSEQAARESFRNFVAYLVKWLYHHILGSDMMIGKMTSQEPSADDIFQFTSQYETGIELVDEEHRRLFEIIAQTKELIDSQFLSDKYDQIMELLGQLREYTEVHFKDEEALMERIAYPGLEKQKRAHAAFVERLVEIDLTDMDNIDANQQEYLLNLIRFLASWLSGHILGEDKKIGEYVQKNLI